MVSRLPVRPQRRRRTPRCREHHLEPTGPGATDSVEPPRANSEVSASARRASGSRLTARATEIGALRAYRSEPNQPDRVQKSGLCTFVETLRAVSTHLNAPNPGIPIAIPRVARSNEGRLAPQTELGTLAPRGGASTSADLTSPAVVGSVRPSIPRPGIPEARGDRALAAGADEGRKRSLAKCGIA